ncbi:MAG: hypothetical protein WAT39_05115 [Planctomycetota bacterium]
MNCTTCRFELSQCLDGRLASGRRAVVMEHAEACAACGTFWAELQAAQRLTLQLRRPTVSAGFRDELWQRIQAGEGTPNAVFREPVPLFAKVRYALTGAAAAAAALLGVMWLSPKTGSPGTQTLEARNPSDGGAPTARTANDRPWHQPAPPIDEAPLFSATQAVTSDLVAREAAKHLDQRYATTTLALRRLGERGDDANAVRQVLQNADEFQAFGELLLELRDRQRIEFRPADVGAELRVAVETLAAGSTAQRNLQTVRTIVAPVMSSNRLGAVARTILLAPTLDRREDLEVLREISTQWPDLLPRMFYVLGNDAEFQHQLGLFRSGSVFFQVEDCGPIWVAPRSEVEARDSWLRIQPGRRSNGQTFEVGIRRR